VLVVSVAFGCAGRTAADGAPGDDAGTGGGTVGDSGGGGSGVGGTPVESGGGGAGGTPLGSGGQAAESGGTGSGGQSGTGGGTEASGGAEGGGTGGEATCGESCAAELEQCIDGECRANEAVRAQTTTVDIAGGTFLMGFGEHDNTSPVHEQTVGNFTIDQTEVTAAAYSLCVSAGACESSDTSGDGANEGAPGYENYPVNFVSLHHAEVYCAWMGKRVPTEAEWEYAAGGKQGYEYPWGDGTPAGCIVGALNPQPEHVDYFHGCAVAQFPPNANGLLDMGGSMYELTSSPYCAYSDVTDTGYVPGCDAEDTDDIALRDGGFAASSVTLTRVSHRQPMLRDFEGNQYVSFRCVSDD